MNPHRLTLHFAALCLALFSTTNISAQKQKAPPGGRIAVVVDERLSALRATADLTGSLSDELAVDDSSPFELLRKAETGSFSTL